MIPGTPDPTWESVALSAIGTLAQQGRPFTAWDVATLIHHEPDHPNRWGSVLAKAKAIGLIRRIGYTQSRRPGRDRGVCAVWGGMPPAKENHV